MNEDPIQNYFLKNDEFLDSPFEVQTDTETFSIEHENGIVINVINKTNSANLYDENTIKQINAKLEAGSDIGTAVMGESSVTENSLMDSLIRECMIEVINEERIKKQKLKKTIKSLVSEVINESF